MTAGIHGPGGRVGSARAGAEAIPQHRSPFPFIVARGRSGTTLLRAMFDEHRSMSIPDESRFIVQFAKRRGRYEAEAGFDVERFSNDILAHWAFWRWQLPDPVVLDALSAEPPTDLPAAFRTLYASYATFHGKPRYGDKTPSYVLHIDTLASLFPEAVFIHLIRDGRDVALSYLDADFGAKTLGQAAISWDRYVRAGRVAGERLGPQRYREVRYEELVREPERVLVDLCAFIDLPYDERMLRYHEHADRLVPSLSHKEHHRNLYRPPTVGLRDWRLELSPADAAVFESLAGDLLEDLGYERVTSHPGLRVSLRAAGFRFGTQVRRVAHGTYIRLRGCWRAVRSRVLRRPTVPRVSEGPPPIGDPS